MANDSFAAIANSPAAAWFARSPDLTNWTRDHLVNRNDVYLAYLPLAIRTDARKSITWPPRDQRQPGALSNSIIQTHYQGLDVGHVIGLHAIGTDNMSRSLVIDIDKHGDDDPADPQTNFAAAVQLHAQLAELGFTALLLDSNGGGGFHLLVVFDTPVASEVVFNFGKWLVRDRARLGISQSPEIFPKQPRISLRTPYGSCWRLPGRHHTRQHWTRVWSGSVWLDGHAAIDRLVSHEGDSPDLIPTEARTFRQSKSAGPQPVGSNDWLEILNGCTPGNRHPSLLRLAGHLLGKGVDPAVVEEICVMWDAHRNKPPRGEEHVRATVQDIAARHQLSRGLRRRNKPKSQAITFDGTGK